MALAWLLALTPSLLLNNSIEIMGIGPLALEDDTLELREKLYPYIIYYFGLDSKNAEKSWLSILISYQLNKMATLKKNVPSRIEFQEYTCIACGNKSSECSSIAIDWNKKRADGQNVHLGHPEFGLVKKIFSLCNLIHIMNKWNLKY